MPFFGGGGGDYHIVGTNIKGGNQALPATIGTNNMGLGNGALQSALGADNNIAIGNLSLNAVTTGNNNISIGYDSFPVLAIGAYVVAVGGNTGAESTGSQESVIIGYGAFSSNFVQPHTANAAQQSVIIGTSAVPSGDVTSSVYIGAFARQGNAALSTNAVVIGANTLGLDSSVVIGAGASGDANSIAIGLNTVATANQIIIGDASYTSVQIGGITLASATGALFPSAIIGDPGTEGTGIVIGGVTYDALFKVSDISSADIAQSIIHRHSTTWEPIQVYARSNSNGAGHAAVVNGMLISSQYSAGWTGTEYNLFGRASFQAAATGTISDASSPGDFVIATTPDGGIVPSEALRVRSDKVTQIQAGIQFPAVQVASANVNTLDDYEEGTFTPGATCVTPGDLNAGIISTKGRYVKIGNRVFFSLFIIATPTFTTASGDVIINGLPFTVSSAQLQSVSPCQITNWTAPAGYSAVQAITIAGTASFKIQKQNMAGSLAFSLVQITEFTSGNLTSLSASGYYEV